MMKLQEQGDSLPKICEEGMGFYIINNAFHE